jgi:DnaK suppressor protein
MATTTKSKAAVKTSRYDELKKMLEHRRRELMNEVQGKIRDVRAEGSKDREVLDQGESSEVDIQEDIEFALIQMKSETLSKINEALRRLDESTYGNCFECGDEIAEPRLRNLIAAFEAVAVSVVFKAPQRGVDLVERLRLHLDERELDILLDVDLRALTLVEDVALLVAFHPNVAHPALNFVEQFSAAVFEHLLQLVVAVLCRPLRLGRRRHDA